MPSVRIADAPHRWDRPRGLRRMSSKREKRSGPASSVKHGSARAALLALAALAILGLGAAWFWTRGAVGPDSAGPSGAAAIPAPPSPTDAPRSAEAGTVRRDVPVAPTSPPPEDPARFRGRGRIRGEIRGKDVAVPAHWTLVLEPHPTLVGSEHAESRRIEFEHGETRFDIEDLSLGGYRVRAEAQALNSTEAPALLVRGASEVHVSLYLARAGFVDGFVLDHEGRAAEGLRVGIENTRTRERRGVEADPTGMFVFRELVDGEYRIEFGPEGAPLVAPEKFTFRAPTMRWPRTQLPPTGSARIRIVDAQGAPVADAEIVGSGSPAGIVRGRSGGDGVLVAPYLPPTNYEVRASAPDGRTGRRSFAVGLETRAEVEITVQ